MLSAVLRGHYAYYGLSGNSRAATQAVGQTADPQKDAAIWIVAWATHGALQPTGNDFAMLRLVLLALLPQIGGILLMVGRSTK